MVLLLLPLAHAAFSVSYSTLTLAGRGDVSGAGDVNGDGYGDVLVADASGEVFVYLGSAAGIDVVPAVSLAAHTGVRATVDAAGDLNGDGYGDVIVGDPSFAGGRGRAMMYAGSATGLSARFPTVIAGRWPTDAVGREVAGVGDVDGDGLPDVAVSWGAAGARVYHGAAGGLDLTAWDALSVSGRMRAPGESLVGAGDLNGDGYADVAMGSYQANVGEGALWTFLGGPLGVSATGTELPYPYPGYAFDFCNRSAQFGYALAPLGDVDGDGFDDLAAGAPSEACHGWVYVYYGSSAGLDSTSWTEFWTERGDYNPDLGASLAGGDWNADGIPGIAMGGERAQYADAGAYGWVRSDASLEVEEDPIDLFDADAFPLGSAHHDVEVDPAGDVNGDGCDDLLVSVPGSATTAAVRVYYGAGAGCVAP